MKKTLSFSLLLSCLLLFFVSCKKEKPNQKAPTADAGSFQTIQLPVNTVTVNGSGTSENGAIVGYLWSLILGPNVPIITSPSSMTTTVKGLIAGTYVLQFAVIDKAGLTGVDTVSVKVNPAIQQTLTLQPANNLSEGHVDSYNLAGGSGDAALEIGSWTINGSSTNWRSFLKFDQSQIPVGATIISASLYLYSMPVPIIGGGASAQLGTANAFYVERITGNWNSASLNWNSQPTSTSTNRVTVPQSTSAFENIIIDVTSIEQDIQTNGNYGFSFRLQNEAIFNMRQFASSFYSNAAMRPKLVITFQ